MSIETEEETFSGGDPGGARTGSNPVPSTVTNSVKSAKDAKIFEIIAAPLVKRDGFRHLWLGDSGMGKTYANKAFISWVEKHALVDIILSIDDKSRWEHQYNGTFRANPEHLRREPPRGGESKRHIVFRGIAQTADIKDGVSATDVTQMSWDLVRQSPCTVLINIDELADATNGYQHWLEDIIPQVYRKGRGVGLSVVAGNQLPQLLPREAFGLSDTIGVFRLSGRETEYLLKYRVITEEDAQQIQALNIGEFRFFRKSHPNDTTVYKL